MEEKEIVKYKTTEGHDVTLSEDIVKKYLISGGSKDITEQELKMFLSLCKYKKLNPFLREVYLIKYSEKMPATMVTGKETFLKRAVLNARYQGHRTGISEDGKIAWAEVFVKGYQVPIRCEVDYAEYVGTKPEYKNGNATGKIIPNAMWSGKPKTMLKKVALVQALREAFPIDFGAMYSQEEINTISEPLSVTPFEPTIKAIAPPVSAKMQEFKEYLDDMGDNGTDPQAVREWYDRYEKSGVFKTLSADEITELQEYCKDTKQLIIEANELRKKNGDTK